MGNETSSLLLPSPNSQGHEGYVSEMKTGGDEEGSNYDDNDRGDGSSSGYGNFFPSETERERCDENETCHFYSERDEEQVENKRDDQHEYKCASINIWSRDAWFYKNRVDPFLEASESTRYTTPKNEEHVGKTIKDRLSQGFNSCKSLDQLDTENTLDSQQDLQSKRLFTPPISFFNGLEYTEEEKRLENGDNPASKESDLRPIIKNPTVDGKKSIQCRSFHIVTTAALPWMTGTAINPLLRAAYLNQMNRLAVEEIMGDVDSNSNLMGSVTLCIPWLVDESDRKIVYGNNNSFETPSDQEVHIRKWLEESAKLPLEAHLETNGIRILFYDAKYSVELISIFPIGDIRESIGLEAKDADVCIIEEPEHINVTMPTSHAPWTDTFKHVVGIIHTNYLMYTGPVLAPIVIHFARSVGRLHCDKVIKLSDTLQTFAAEKECTSNVHGIRSDFLEEGKRRALMNTQESSNKIYFIGKLLWAKGLDRLLTLENSYKKKTGHYFDIDIIGSGAEAEEIQRAFHGRGGKRPFSSHGSLSDLVHEIPKSRHEFRKDPIPASFLGRMDHALLTDEYKIFVNPSITEVLCTTTAEAIAMGKFVIIPYHPSNVFFEQFPNCLFYKQKEEFISKLLFAQSNEPVPLSTEHSYALTWKAANERLIEASKITKREARRRLRIGQAEFDEKAKKSTNGTVFQGLQRYIMGTMDMCTTVDHDNNKSGHKNALPIECQ